MKMEIKIIITSVFLAFFCVFFGRTAEAAPAYQGVGAFDSGTGNLSVAVPSGYQDGDVFLLFVESANENILAPAGWTEIVDSPQSTGTPAAAGGVRLAVFYKVVSGAQASVIVTDSGNHTTAIIANFRGVDPSSPIHTTSGSVDASPTSAISTPSIMTTIPSTMIINAIGLDKDANDKNTITSAPVNSDLSDLAERHDQTVNSGVGGGIAFFTGEREVIGAVGPTVAVADSATTHAYITIALKPLPSPPQLSISDPDGVKDVVYAGDPYSIIYSLSDIDDIVTVAFYYDVDNVGLDGVPISGDCAAAPEGVDATCAWNTAGVPSGTYYVYGIVNDGTFPQVEIYSLGMVTVELSGSLSVDIVDAAGLPVISPSIVFPNRPFSWLAQQSSATLGTSSQIVRVSNSRAVSSWTVSIAATLGSASLWNGAAYSYDYNGTATAGRLMVDASSATVTPEPGCSVAAITKTPATYFSEGVQDQISMVISGENSPSGCYWDITGTILTQDIPVMQEGDNYSLALTLTAI